KEHAMGWFGRWFSRGTPERRTVSRAPTFRPHLEPLEDRRLLNVSSVIDASGQRTVFAVYTNNDMYRYDNTGAHILAHNVLRAHGYRDSDGSVGVTVIYTSFAAFNYDHFGGRLLGVNIVDADLAYDRGGHAYYFFTTSEGSNFHTFRQIDNEAAFEIVVPGTIATLIHPFQDAHGGLGLEVSYFDTVTSNVLIEYDSDGVRFLAHDAVADRTWDTSGVNFELAVTYISDQAFIYSRQGALFVGNNIAI